MAGHPLHLERLDSLVHETPEVETQISDGSGLEGPASPIGMDASAIDVNKDGATNMGKKKYDSSQLSSGDSLPLLFQSGPHGTLRKWGRPSTHRDNRIATRVHRVTPPRTISSKDASHCCYVFPIAPLPKPLDGVSF